MVTCRRGTYPRPPGLTRPDPRGPCRPVRRPLALTTLPRWDTARSPTPSATSNPRADSAPSTPRSTPTSRPPPSSAGSTRPAARRSSSGRLKGTAFPAVGNLFGTRERTHFLFRDTLETVRRLVELKVRAAGRPPPAVPLSGVPARRRCISCRGASVAARSWRTRRPSTGSRRSSPGRETAARS